MFDIIFPNHGPGNGAGRRWHRRRHRRRMANGSCRPGRERGERIPPFNPDERRALAILLWPALFQRRRQAGATAIVRASPGLTLASSSPKSGALSCRRAVGGLGRRSRIGQAAAIGGPGGITLAPATGLICGLTDFPRHGFFRLLPPVAGALFPGNRRCGPVQPTGNRGRPCRQLL
jgi:hypothetical protein